MFDGPVDLDVATTLIEKGPAQFEWTSIVEKNKVQTTAVQIYVLVAPSYCSNITSAGLLEACLKN